MTEFTITPQAPATQPAASMLPATPSPRGPQEIIRIGMDTVQGFEAMQRAAKMLASSTLVPEAYRMATTDKRTKEMVQNPAAIPNCIIAMNMANRLGADPLMVMQNLYIVEGKPGWSSVYIIASINSCRKFSPLRFDLSKPGEEVEVEYTYTKWVNKQPQELTGRVKIRHQTCRARAVELATGEWLDGPEVSMQMALEEGWIQKNGSKWRTMPEVMLRYRAASFFGKLYAPDLLMGLQAAEELGDVLDGEVIREEAPAHTATLPASNTEEHSRPAASGASRLAGLKNNLGPKDVTPPAALTSITAATVSGPDEELPWPEE